MITSAIIYILSGALFAVLSPLLLLSDVSLTSGIGQSIISAGQYLSILDPVIPVATIIAVIALLATIEISIAAFKVIKWVYKKIPGIN